jgi:hypothetical protein
MGADPAVIFKTALALEEMFDGFDNLDVAKLFSRQQREAFQRHMSPGRKCNGKKELAGNCHCHVRPSKTGNGGHLSKRRERAQRGKVAGHFDPCLGFLREKAFYIYDDDHVNAHVYVPTPTSARNAQGIRAGGAAIGNLVSVGTKESVSRLET